jgi:hypothetical protein
MIKESVAELKQIQKDLNKRRLEILKELKQIDDDLSLVEGVILIRSGKIQSEKNEKNGGISKEEIPEKYDISLFQEKKIIYAISILKEATVKELADYMHKQEKNSDYDALYKRAQQVVIRLTKENKLIKIGDYASKYKLNMINK